jgi:Mg-chelatase subunit ChlD
VLGQRYELLASALAGRRVDVVAIEPGAPAWTDGATIFVAADASARGALRAIGVQASLLAAGSFDPAVTERIGRRGAVARRYLLLEGHRALAAQEGLLPAAARSLIDPTVAARTESPADSLALALSREMLAEPPPDFGTLRPRQIRPVPQHVARRERQDLVRELEDDSDDDDGRVDVSSPVGGGGAVGRLLKKMLGDARTQSGGPPGVDTPRHWSKRASRRGDGAVTTSTATLPNDVTAVDRRGLIYPEWDIFHRRYRPDWCTVLELEETREPRAPLTPPAAHPLRRPLARLGVDLERRHRQLNGDDVDIDAAVEAFVDATAGSAPAEALYVDSLRSRRDLSVLLLLDISGSAGEPGTTGGTVHEHQRAAAAALAVALHDLGDRVALYGFRSQGRSAVHVVPVKRFDDELDARALHRLGALVPGGYTRLGAAIRHGAAVLEASGGTPRRLLVVLSDGFAYDHGYEGAYSEADARRALAEARRRGIGCLCISIGADTEADALRRVFGTAAHASLPREEQLAGVVGPLFRAALRSAEVQRRAWQRKERTRERLALER